ncbi:conserved hypothetical protein [Burkholderiales bacterium 8X]|nr:conserved hypothetical protein [Burkholderiales bacterium 8X]
MLWLLVSLFFCWLIWREFRLRRVARRGYDRPIDTPVSKPYIAALLVLALLFAWTPFKYWRFERFLSAKASLLADGKRAVVHCNTVFDTFFDRETLAAGHANPLTGQIVLQHPYCGELMDFIDSPARPQPKGIVSLNIFTHESMHIRGELNEALTECQSVQRNARAAVLLGVPEVFARKAATEYYQRYYLRRVGGEGFNAVYASDQCAPGKAMDERLADSTWRAH